MRYGVITNTRVRYRPLGLETDYMDLLLPKMATEAKLSSLDLDSIYEITIDACTDKGFNTALKPYATIILPHKNGSFCFFLWNFNSTVLNLENE